MNIYKTYSQEQLENIFSNYLISSWSYSKVAAFARHEKAFEMSYIYNSPFKESASTVAGSAYHAALDFYFKEKKEGRKADIVSLQKVAFDYIDDVLPSKWKLQKTTPSIDECRAKANECSVSLLENFFGELSVYESDIKTVLDVELKLDEFLTVNGVDIPIPCRMKIDLVVETIAGKIAVIDHKSKAAFTDEKELKFSIGKQGITYVLGYETKHGLAVDEVWFIENKISKNRDKSIGQLSCFKMILDENSRRLYEALLYEPLKRMLEAVSNPDYIYLINESDNYVDLAELYEFWAQTMMAEVADFNIPDSKKELIKKRLKKIRDTSLANVDPLTIKKFRENAAEFIQYDLTNKNMSKQEKIEHTLRTLNIPVKVEHTFTGYSSDTFLMRVSAGTNLGSVYRYKLDIANALNVSSVRMNKDLFVYKEQSYLAVEAVKKREEDLLFDLKYLDGGKIPIGMNNFGEVVYWDTQNPSTPHMLVCGSTGSGKSVLLKSVLEYALAAGYDEVYFLDPKFEFLKYKSSKVTVHNDIEEIEECVEKLVAKMNRLVKAGNTKKILIIFDEFADSVANSRSGGDLKIKEEVVVGKYASGVKKTKLEVVEVKKSLEENLRILLQKGRSSGFRIIAATQRASVKVITGDAKVNFPVQICFKVPKEVDSKVIIDEAGAESLAGMGDGLLKSPQYQDVQRFQAFYKK